jgi:putative ABC transport system substrate-binding protein
MIITGGTPGTRAAKEATTTIPIVMAVSGDAVAYGLVASLNRPGGNVTGSSFFNPELSVKRLELIKEAAPQITKIGYLYNSDNSGMGPLLEMMKPAAASLKMQFQLFPIRTPNEIETAALAMAKDGVHGLTADEDGMLNANAKAIAEAATKRGLPSIAGRDLVEGGGLIGYGANLPELWRRAATFVDKLLKGAKPADVPVEQATRFELIINRRTGRVLGIEFPLTLLVRADEVIE